jgi:hypothetical protein
MFFDIFWAAYIPIGVILICIVGKALMLSLRESFAQRISPQQLQLANERRDDERRGIRAQGARDSRRRLGKQQAVLRLPLG